MRWDGGSRGHPHFNLDGGLPRGKTNLVRAAVDPVKPPQDPVIVGLLERCLCVCAVGYNAFEVKGMDGTIIDVPFGATFDQWKQACEKLLDLAMKNA